MKKHRVTLYREWGRAWEPRIFFSLRVGGGREVFLS